MKSLYETVVFALIIGLLGGPLGKINSQFIDNFDPEMFKIDSTAMNGWWYYSGDGSAIMDFVSQHGFATIHVDATKDQRNVWWALIRRYVSEDFELVKLSRDEYELRIETRIRVSHAPRRVNLHLNTQRTTDFHSHLMEFDIPDTLNWHVISMTTNNFDAKPGDLVYGQLALIDWGFNKYSVDVDYFRVDIVNVDSIGPDDGVQIPYHPPVPDVKTFTHHILVSQDGMIDREYPDINFNNWASYEEGIQINLLPIGGTQVAIMRWDLNEFAGKRVIGSGLLELHTYALQRKSSKQKDSGMIRISEILGGDPDWNQKTVTYNSFCLGETLNKVLNSQMIIDFEVAGERGNTNLITISNPVLQRMINGRTLGLAIHPLGPVHATFYTMENQSDEIVPMLHFNVERDFRKSAIPEKIGVFESNSDIGSVKLAGSAIYDSDKQRYLVTGSGENMWDTVDACHFVWSKTSGDLKVSANIVWLEEGGHEHRKAGLMIRQGLESDAAYVDIVVHGDGLIAMQYREQKGAITQEVKAPIRGFSYIQLERVGDCFTFSLAAEDQMIKPFGNIEVKLSGQVYSGLVVCSHDSTIVEKAVFTNVRINN